MKLLAKKILKKIKALEKEIDGRINTLFTNHEKNIKNEVALFLRRNIRFTADKDTGTSFLKDFIILTVLKDLYDKKIKEDPAIDGKFNDFIFNDFNYKTQKTSCYFNATN